MSTIRSDALSKAIEALERAAAAPGATSEVLTLYGRALLRADQIDAAERVLQQATLRFPVDPDAFLAYADVAERQNHLAAARSALVAHGALADGADGPSQTTRIAALSLRMKEPAIAAEWYGRALSAAPNDLRLMAALADAQLRAGDRTEAAATIGRGLERDPENAVLLALSRRLP
jgi:predicted Zn-dependent protease